jgi:hypothetical protein
LLDELRKPLALAVLEHRVDFSERADKGLAQTLERGVMPCEQLAEARRVKAFAAHGRRDIVARFADFLALCLGRVAELLERVPDDFLLLRLGLEPVE